VTNQDSELHIPLGRVRDVVRLQKSVLPGHAVQILADEVVTRLASRLNPGIEPARITEMVPIDDFCRALISHDAEAAMQMVRQERLDGLSIESIYVGTLAVAASRLGDWWKEDRVSFLEMTVAAGRIFEIMRHLRRMIPVPHLSIGPERQALFATIPSEMHTLGVTMAADLFRNRGWEIDLRVGYEHEELMSAVADRRYRVIGLSAGSAAGVVPLARCVVAFRITHPGARIFVSGGVVSEVPGIAAIIGADGAAADLAGGGEATADWEAIVQMVTGLADRN
jgi:methanogenic corrinoid protein MtbC1